MASRGATSAYYPAHVAAYLTGATPAILISLLALGIANTRQWRVLAVVASLVTVSTLVARPAVLDRLYLVHPDYLAGWNEGVARQTVCALGTASGVRLAFASGPDEPWRTAMGVAASPRREGIPYFVAAPNEALLLSFQAPACGSDATAGRWQVAKFMSIADCQGVAPSRIRRSVMLGQWS